MKLGAVVDIYNVLGEATVAQLTSDERMEVVKVLKATRPHAKEYDEFVNDLREKFKTANTDAIIQKIQMNKGLTEAEASEFMECNTPVSKAIHEEREREVEINLPTIGEDAVLKMIGENGWKMKVRELFDY